MYLFIILSVVTSIYLLLSARMDFKERKIYSFPGMILSLSWVAYLFSTGAYENSFLVAYTLFNAVICFFFNQIKMWGAGDSDMFLLMSNVLLAVTGPISGIGIMFLECIAVIGVLFFAILFGFVESKLKGEKINFKSKVAVVPGFALVIIMLLVIAVIGRVF